MSRPVGSMGGRWPNYHWSQIPTIAAHAFYGCHSGTLDTRTSIVSLVILTYKDFHRAELGKHHPCLVHVVPVLLTDVWGLPYLFDYLKPLYDLIMDVVQVTIPIQRLHSFRFEFWMAFFESLRPVPAWRLEPSIRGALARDRKGQ
jgi:hypothetical protein